MANVVGYECSYTDNSGAVVDVRILPSSVSLYNINNGIDTISYTALHPSFIHVKDITFASSSSAGRIGLSDLPTATLNFSFSAHNDENSQAIYDIITGYSNLNVAGQSLQVGCYIEIYLGLTLFFCGFLSSNDDINGDFICLDWRSLLFSLDFQSAWNVAIQNVYPDAKSRKILYYMNTYTFTPNNRPFTESCGCIGMMPYSIEWLNGNNTISNYLNCLYFGHGVNKVDTCGKVIGHRFRPAMNDIYFAPLQVFLENLVLQYTQYSRYFCLDTRPMVIPIVHPKLYTRTPTPAAPADTPYICVAYNKKAVKGDDEVIHTETFFNPAPEFKTFHEFLQTWYLQCGVCMRYDTTLSISQYNYRNSVAGGVNLEVTNLSVLSKFQKISLQDSNSGGLVEYGNTLGSSDGIIIEPIFTTYLSKRDNVYPMWISRDPDGAQDFLGLHQHPIFHPTAEWDFQDSGGYKSTNQPNAAWIMEVQDDIFRLFCYEHISTDTFSVEDAPFFICHDQQMPADTTIGLMGNNAGKYYVSWNTYVDKKYMGSSYYTWVLPQWQRQEDRVVTSKAKVLEKINATPKKYNGMLIYVGLNNYNYIPYILYLALYDTSNVSVKSEAFNPDVQYEYQFNYELNRSTTLTGNLLPHELKWDDTGLMTISGVVK